MAQKSEYAVFSPVRAEEVLRGWYALAEHRRTVTILDETAFLFNNSVCALYLSLSDDRGALTVVADAGAKIPRCIDDVLAISGVVLLAQVKSTKSAREEFVHQPYEDAFQRAFDKSYEAAKTAVEADAKR